MSALYLSQITTGRRKPSAVMAGRIAKATGFKVSLESLRPDIYQVFKEQGAIQQETPKNGSTDDASDDVTPPAEVGGTVQSASSEGA
ncbi:hypothetical protein SAMN02745130_01040 [Thiothrix eikelboomii]|uniref:HTH cro/C1-type domain-containing protein n=2 Tax=Thiothrix eikelboomii TaxID=92487 RepID=A0A1T4W4U5_9GAMM|nr:hypothetical protein SAMN02745130_01040 [Thiothrix eikelboomii]